MPAPSTKPFQNSSASCGSNVPIHSDDRVDLVDEERAAREVERDLHERFVERARARSRTGARRALSPSASLQRGAEHDADVFDGVVQVDLEVARGLDREVEAAVLAELLEHVVEERDAGRDARRVPAPSTIERRASIVVSFVSRCSSARLRASSVTSRPPRRASPSAARNASFSSGVPTVTRRQPSSRGQRREVADEHAALDQPLPQRVARRRATRNSRKLAPDGHDRDAVDARRARRTSRLALLDQRARRARSISAPKLERDRARDLRRHRQVVRQHAPSRARRPPTAARPRSRAAARPATTPSSTCARPTSGRSSSTSSSALHGANSPYASSTTSERAVVGAAASSRSTVARGSTVPVGLFGLHTNTIDGCAARDERRRAASGSIVKSARRSPATTSVPVMRAMCACSAYVGSNISARRPGPP